MPIVDDILETLGQAALKINTGKTSQSIVVSYDAVTELIQKILSGEGSDDAIDALTVVVTRPGDPDIWGEPVIWDALNTLDAERIQEIHAATYILANRLPGKTKIPRPKINQAIGDVAKASSGEGEEESA